MTKRTVPQRRTKRQTARKSAKPATTPVPETYQLTSRDRTLVRLSILTIERAIIESVDNKTEIERDHHLFQALQACKGILDAVMLRAQPAGER